MKLRTLLVSLLSLGYALPSSTPDKASRSPGKSVDLDIPQLFSEDTTAKIWRVAQNLLDEVRCSLLTAPILTFSAPR